MGGFWILEAADMDEALAWARKGPSHAMRRARCASFFSTGPEGQRNSLAAARLAAACSWPCLPRGSLKNASTAFRGCACCARTAHLGAARFGKGKVSNP